MPTPAELMDSARAALANARALETAAQKAEEAAKLTQAASNLSALADKAEETAAASKKAVGEADDANKRAAQLKADADETAAKAVRAESDAAKKEAEAAETDARMLAEFANNPAAWKREPPFDRIVRAFTSLSTYLMIFAGAVIVYLLYGVTNDGGEFLKVLADTGSSRGLITFLITASTVSIAVMLIYQAFAQGTNGENFRMAREIFAALVGVLGTIVGFYFGVATQEAKPLMVSPPIVEDGKLTISVSGGKPPYHWVIEEDANAGLKKIEDDLSGPGDVIVTLPELKADGTAKLTVTDKDGATDKSETPIKK